MTPMASKNKLTWSPGAHRGSSDVVHVAEDPSPTLKHGSYRIVRGEGGARLVYERWRDDHGGSVPIQHVLLGEGLGLADAKSTAEAHHAERRRAAGGPSKEGKTTAAERVSVGTARPRAKRTAIPGGAKKTSAEIEREIKSAVAAEHTGPQPRGLSPHLFRRAKWEIYDARGRLIGDAFADSAEEAIRNHGPGAASALRRR
jgi:hypothetical protein